MRGAVRRSRGNLGSCQHARIGRADHRGGKACKTRHHHQFRASEGRHTRGSAALADSELWRAVVPYAKIHYRKFKAAFEASLDGLSIHRLSLLGEEFSDAGVSLPAR